MMATAERLRQRLQSLEEGELPATLGVVVIPSGVLLEDRNRWISEHAPWMPVVIIPEKVPLA